MSHLSNEKILHVANLARLELGEDELDRFSKEINDILDYIDQLSKLDTTGVPQTSHALKTKNVFREDVPKESLSNEEALLNAPEKAGPENEYFSVPKVLPSEEEAS